MNYVRLIFLFVLFSNESCSPSIDDLYDKAYKLKERKEYKKAIEVFGKITRRNSKLQDAIFEKGYCYLQDSNYTRALHFFEFVLSMKGVNNRTGFILEMNPDSPIASEADRHQVSLGEIYYQIGVAKYCMDSMKSSYQNFKNAIYYKYEVANSYAWLGAIWNATDNKQKACEFFKKSKEMGDEDGKRLSEIYCKSTESLNK
jgi:tetratricopeptide (TPR) repeat protein